MSNTSLDLSNKLPADQTNIIRQVVHAATTEGLGLFIVGAQARDLLIQYVYDLPVHRERMILILALSSQAGMNSQSLETP